MAPQNESPDPPSGQRAATPSRIGRDIPQGGYGAPARALELVAQKLRAREEQLRLITNALPVLIAYVDDETIYQFANDTYEKWFGLRADEVVGKSMQQVLGEAAWRSLEGHVRAVLSGEVVSWTATIPYAVAGERYVQIDYIPHFTDPDGRVAGFFVLVQDMTARLEAEEKLKRSEAEYRAIFELAGSGKAQADAVTGRFLRVNRRFCEITGYSANELLQLTLRDLTHPDDWEEDRARVDRVRQGLEPRWQSEKRYVKKNGEPVWVLVTGTLIRHSPDEPGYTIATVQDVTARKLAEQQAEERAREAEEGRAALRESEERFRTLADNISQFAWIADASGSIFWYNRRWFDYTGSTLEEMQGWGWTKVHHPDHVDRVATRFREHIEQGKVWEDVFPLRSAAGDYRWFLSRAMPIRNEEGNVVRWFGTNTDISERMAMENALKEADRKKDEFLAILAHELRNPLAPIRTGIELLQQEDLDRDTGRQILRVMRRQTAQLVRLVDDLLDVSRFTRGEIALRRSIVPLSKVLASAIESTRPLLEQAGHRLVLNLPPEELLTDGDFTRLSQIFSNLISNAAKYSPQPCEITIEARSEGERVAVAVRDRGIGIAPENIPQIFEMFSQLEDPLDRNRGGLGIGLTLVKSLVELHSGSIEVDSRPGEGSEFRVRFPRAAAPPPAPVESDGEKRPPAARRLDILVVDDNEDAATLLQKLLARQGHDVRVAFDGESALAIAGVRAPEVVLLDLGMPRMNGYELAERIRESSWGKDVFLVAVTGWAQDEIRGRAKDAGFGEHLVKPVSSARLRELLAARFAS